MTDDIAPEFGFALEYAVAAEYHGGDLSCQIRRDFGNNSDFRQGFWIRVRPRERAATLDKLDILLKGRRELPVAYVARNATVRDAASGTIDFEAERGFVARIEAPVPTLTDADFRSASYVMIARALREAETTRKS